MSTTEELAQELYSVRQMIHRLKLRETDLVDRLAADMTTDVLEIDGLGAFERRYGKKRTKWDHEALYGALRRNTRTATFADPETGEVLSDFDKAFYVLEKSANPSWRTKALKEFGIQADEYAEVTPGLVTIQFHGAFDEKDDDQ